MRSLKVVVVLLAIVGVSSIASASLFVDDFESYAAGSSLHGQGGWKGWDNDPTWTAFASDVQANSGNISAAIGGSADLVHEFDFAGGKLELSAMQYIPVGGTGQSFFLLLNQYNDGGPYDWSVQLNCNMDTGQIISDFGGGSLPIKWGEWVQLKLVIDLVANNVYEYYDGTLLSSHEWDDTWNGTLECIDLFGNGASSIYYDDITVDPPPIYNTTQDRWYESIQSAIDYSNANDEIEVAPGTYYEAINFNGKAVRLYSSGGPEVTTIDASGLDSSVVTCVSGEDANTILEGFTLTGGNAYKGGGMYNDYSSPTVTNCIFISNAASLHGGGMYNFNYSSPAVTNCTFSGNSTSRGGGMFNLLSSPTVTNCTFSGNSAAEFGGGMRNESCSPTMINCTFSGNSAQYEGGGMYNYNSYPAVTNCTFSGNSAGWSGGGMYNYSNSNAIVTNCILWGNTPDEIYNTTSTPIVTYSDVEGGWSGTGNINTNPLFVDTETENLRLGWGSPCVDSGNNDAVPGDVTTDLDVNPRFADDTGIPDTGYGTAPIVDMGAYERQISSIGPICNVTQGLYYFQIQAAIDAALDGDEIEVGPGTYDEAIDFKSQAVRLYSSSGPEVTTIDGTGYYHVVQCVSGEDANTILEGFTITGGNANGPYPDNSGGGMYNYQSSPTVINCIFTGNIADYGGAGMCNEDNSNPMVTNCTFSGNSADYGGGGMGNENNSNPIVTSCTFIGNISSDGAGMGNENNSNPTVTNCSFSYNIAAYSGGGMYSKSGSSPIVENCTFSGNYANGETTDMGGGGMYNWENSPTVTNCTFNSNSAPWEGGGMRNWSSSPTVTNCTFRYNYTPRDGGGMFNKQSSVTLTNCTFSGNWGGYGGGMYNYYNSNPAITNCTFSSNTASANGGGIINYYYSSPTVTNCILWVNSPNEIVDSDQPNSASSVSYSDVGGGWFGAGDNNIDADPFFVYAAAGNLRLSDWSPCADAGNNDAVPAGVTTDLDGNPRLADDVSIPDTGSGSGPIVDMGAYERQIDSVGPIRNVTQGLYYLQIQAAIDAALDGDEIEVAAGTYYEAINFVGKAVRLYSIGGPDVTTIDGTGYYHVVQCVSGEDANTILEGFNITGGNANGPTFPDDQCGGGMVNAYNSNPTITNCTFSSNSAAGYGGGMCNAYNSSPTVTNCTFSGNTAPFGGGMLNVGSSPTVTNCTFSNNSALSEGAGMYNEESSPTVTNCIFWDNSPDEIYNDSSSIPIVTYSDVQGGYTGTGNIDSDPLFVDAAGGDLRLRSDASPCVDAGNNGVPGLPATDLAGNPRVIDGDWNDTAVVDMGAYEFQPGQIHNINKDRWYETIQVAIDDANEGDEIEVGPGAYYESINFNGRSVRLYSSGGPEITTINGTGHLHVVQCVSDEGAGTILEGFTITGGNAQGSGGPDFNGGGMYNNGSSPTVTNCTFSGNSATTNGGGMYNESSSPTVTNCEFLNNSASWDGGGMGNENNSNPMVTNCSFSSNIAAYSGGGMYNENSNPTVTNCTFNNNDSGMGNYQNSPTIINCTFNNNDGGMNNSQSSPTVTNCTFNDNYYGIYNHFSSPTFTNCTFSGNASYGMQNYYYSSSTVTNCTFNNNSYEGMYNYYYGSPTVTNCTFSGNSDYGMTNGAESSPNVNNCIFWGNSPDEIYNYDVDSVPIVTYSDVQGGYLGTGNIDADPFFVDVAGGDLRLASGSPCIDAGNNTAVPSDVLKDLAGKLRFADDPYTDDTGDDGMTGRPVVDMGAYEFQGCGTISQNHMANPGFETGDATGWVTNWGFDLEATTALFHAGNYSGLASERDASWQGAWQSLLGLMDDGKTYRISGWVRLQNATNDYVALTVKKVDSTGDHYYSIDNATAYDDKWVKLDGTLNFDADESMTDLYIYFEGPEPEVEFYVDDASVTEVMGDMDHNGCVDLIDFSLFASYYGFDCSLEDCGGANFNDCDNTINELDLAILCSNWLVGVE